MQKRYENPKAVDVAIDADGWPSITIWTAEGTADMIRLHPQGHAEIKELKSGPGYDGNYQAYRKIGQADA